MMTNLLENLQQSPPRRHSLGYVALERIVAPADSLPPSRAFINSIRLYGVIEPLLLTPGDAKGSYEILNGRRRYRAAVELGLTHVPATLLLLDDAENLRAAALTIATNRFRSENPVAATRAAATLFKAGVDDHEIQKLTGLQQAEIAKLRKLTVADPRILHAVAIGRCNVSHGFQIAALPPAIQAQVLEQMESPGPVGVMIREAKQARNATVLPAELFHEVPTVDQSNAVDRVMEMVRRLQLTPEDLRTLETKLKEYSHV
jgi:ParB/RepB/Spo0J family partition protein